MRRPKLMRDSEVLIDLKSPVYLDLGVGATCPISGRLYVRWQKFRDRYTSDRGLLVDRRNRFLLAHEDKEATMRLFLFSEENRAGGSE